MLPSRCLDWGLGGVFVGSFGGGEARCEYPQDCEECLKFAGVVIVPKVAVRDAARLASS